MKTVRQLVARTSHAEGKKDVGDEYGVSADRAKQLAARGFVEILDADEAAASRDAAAADASAEEPKRRTRAKRA